jgi:hypothetical protein
MTAPWLDMIADRGRLILMIVIHLDDSGNADDPICTLAGYLATAAEWARFEDEARAYFDAMTPRLEYLHTMDLHQLDGYWKGWERDDTKAFAADLFTILAKYAPVGIEFSVDRSAFNAKKKALGLKREGAPMTFCFKGMVSRLFQNAAIQEVFKWPEVDISFVIEAGNKHENAIVQAFRDIKTVQPRLRSLIHEDKKKLIALQAADFLAYFSRRLRVKDELHRRYNDEYMFFHDVSRRVAIHDHFLATNFYGPEGPPA